MILQPPKKYFCGLIPRYYYSQFSEKIKLKIRIAHLRHLSGVCTSFDALAKTALHLLTVSPAVCIFDGFEHSKVKNHSILEIFKLLKNQ